MTNSKYSQIEKRLKIKPPSHKATEAGGKSLRLVIEKAKVSWVMGRKNKK